MYTSICTVCYLLVSYIQYMNTERCTYIHTSNARNLYRIGIDNAGLIRPFINY